MRPTRALSALPVLAAIAALAGCGSSSDSSTSSSSSAPSGATTAPAASTSIASNPSNASTTITVGSKNFTEQKVLGEVYAQALQAAGYKIHKQLNLGDEKTALKALKSDQISAYPEYTGTALLSFFNVPTDKLPKDPTQAYDQVKADFAKQGIDALPPTPFTSSNEVALNADKAKQLGLTNISDLKGKSQNLSLYGTPECRQRLDCLLGLQKVYGLKFKKFQSFDANGQTTLVKLLQKNSIQAADLFTTDPTISANKFVVLQDPKNVFSAQNVTPLIYKSGVNATAQAALNAVSAKLTTQDLLALMTQLVTDKKDPDTIAKGWLSQAGLGS
jgi:osmoprotectant transport system substrate-binding protein